LAQVGLAALCPEYAPPLNGISFASVAKRGEKQMAAAAPAAAAPAVQAECSDEDNETPEEPKRFQRPRRGGIIAEPYVQGYYKEPFWNKHEKWDLKLREVMRTRSILAHVTDSDITKLIRSMSTHIYYSGDCIAHQGEDGDYLFVVLEGQVDSYYDVLGGAKSGQRPHQNERELKEQELKDRVHSTKHTPGIVVDEIACIWRLPRPVSHYARGEQVIIAKLDRQDYVNLVVRSKISTWWSRQDRLVKVPLLEMMEPEQIAKLVDVMTTRKYLPGQDVVRQSDFGDEFFILASGSAKAWAKIGDDVQEFARFSGGDLFGELALLRNAKRAATVTILTRSECLVLGRKQFERVLGPMSILQNTHYLTDPRKLIGEFYKGGDDRGSLGSLKMLGKEVDPAKKTEWFVVYRPTSRDAIAKMLSGNAVGKGLNVKGKSSKQGVLSGYVPFSQISNNNHRSMIEKSPKGARTKLYFRSKAAREEALKKLLTVMNSLEAREYPIENRKIDMLEDFAPKVFGLNLPEPVLHETYLMRMDLSPVMGWETGRRSEPAFMDMNLHAIRDASVPQVVLYQFDESDPMNPRGLLIAYAEDLVKPVVSDFDTFTIASRGMTYDPVPEDQQKIVCWMLEHAEAILKAPDHNPWGVRWLEVLKKEGEKGFHPKFPKYGFGDPTSYRLIGDVVTETKDCGAIRHGAECFNYYFPQELDDEYLVVWEGFPDKPWAYKTEKTMREFLLERMKDGYSFPLNPVWPCRDKGWWDVWEASLQVTSAHNMASWYNKKLGVVDIMNRIHASCPTGFIQSADVAEAAKKKEEKPAEKSTSKEKSAAAAPLAPAPSGSSQNNAPAGAKKGGFFGKLFGKK